jgi:hypothetical protein
VVGEWSGKAMQISVPNPGTVFREMVTRVESEGHFFWFAASLVQMKRALAEPKYETPVPLPFSLLKLMI